MYTSRRPCKNQTFKLRSAFLTRSYYPYTAVTTSVSESAFQPHPHHHRYRDTGLPLKIERLTIWMQMCHSKWNKRINAISLKLKRHINEFHCRLAGKGNTQVGHWVTWWQIAGARSAGRLNFVPWRCGSPGSNLFPITHVVPWILCWSRISGKFVHPLH
jgi:hypothetical protein